MTTLLSVTNAAQALRTTPFRVMELCRTGELACGDIDGVMVIPLSAVQEYARRHAVRDDVPAV